MFPHSNSLATSASANTLSRQRPVRVVHWHGTDRSTISGQTLIVTVGCGWAQRWGGPIEEIHPGDVVRFSPGEKHWHGATPTTAMTHIAIQEKHDGKAQGVANVQLAATEIVQKLVDRNAKRVKALEGYRGRRSYDLDYVGFPANLHATMIVDVKYTAPATKEFTVVSQSGSKWVINHVFKRLLETEREALEGENWKRTSLDSKNYDFTLVADGRADERCPYTLEVEPKVATKFLYRGRIWVDAEDFTVCRIEAEPAKNPSFWIQRTDISHVYLKVREFLASQGE